MAERLGEFHVIAQWSNHVTKAQKRQPCNKALVMSHIVWLISKFYLLLLGNDTVFIFFKKRRIWQH